MGVTSLISTGGSLLYFIGTGSHYGIEMWSEAIDIFSTAPVKLLHLSEVGGIKVTMETCQLSRHIHIQSVLKAEVWQHFTCRFMY